MNILGKTIVFFILATASGCKLDKEKKVNVNLDIQGHRGCRGLMPENTIPAFIKAVELGVTTLELDLAVTANKKLLVSHEPYMSSNICVSPDGSSITKEEQNQYNIFQMSMEEVRKYDCGLKTYPRFPEQKKVATSKPLLLEVVQSVNEHILRNELPPIQYNIEIKSSPEGDSIYHPAPAEFSDLLYQFIQKNMIPEDVTVQSFDFRVLQYFHEKYPAIQLAVLIESNSDYSANIARLGFTPQIYSCDYTLLNNEVIKALQKMEMKVIPWTVNDTEEMNRLIDWGVDGIITDYPDKARKLTSK